MQPETKNTVEAFRAGAEIDVADFESAEWEKARGVRLMRYWSGEEAPPERHAEARLLWTDAALCVRFVCRQAEPLIVSSAPRLEEKTINLWERDVCEIFVAPDVRVPERYFEFEAAPTGEWLDLAIHQMEHMRETNWRYHSGMSAASRVADDSIVIAMRVPWASLVATTTRRPPRAGERWRVNLCRCVGSDPQRGYLAWQPTHSDQPNFHVPQKFGWLYFRK